MTVKKANQGLVYCLVFVCKLYTYNDPIIAQISAFLDIQIISEKYNFFNVVVAAQFFSSFYDTPNNIGYGFIRI